MATPLFDALQQQLATKRERFFMPGHKGVLAYPLSEAAPFDMTELPLTGSLFEDTEPFLSIEKTIEAFYHSGKSLLSAGGSTLCIQTMLSLFCPPQSKVLMARHSHVAAIHSAALLDLRPVWLYADKASGVGTAGVITAAGVRTALCQSPDVSAVYLTSPDYFGSMVDVAAISEVCREFSVPLLIDNAHGPHLTFFGLHPMELCADACCDSLHKTLPCMTGAAVLHLQDAALAKAARRRMSMFGSTSPSYPILLSIDFAAAQLSELRQDYIQLAKEVAVLRCLAEQKGIWATIGDCDPLRIALLFAEGKRETTLQLLADCSIEAEYLSDRHIVLLPSLQTNLGFIRQLIDKLQPLDEPPYLPLLPKTEKAMEIRQAIFSPTRAVAVEESIGLIAAQTLATCPPGLPILMPGERISKHTVKYFTGIIETVMVY